MDYDLLEPVQVRYPESSTYRKRVTVFRDLWRKGFYLTTGVNFGCDFLAYERLPGERHSR